MTTCCTNVCTCEWWRTPRVFLARTSHDRRKTKRVGYPRGNARGENGVSDPHPSILNCRQPQASTDRSKDELGPPSIATNAMPNPISTVVHHLSPWKTLATMRPRQSMTVHRERREECDGS
ncbi:hypothetical protein Ae201684P_008500 [Aphanomyces euteiches]|uniref:Uncharacterized protein n=1 Tax=Aphanomyces euteiches TaxID=100861 RepID=A0A6G0XF10_9STRA|nr:hypothetical protein Ae201684_005457 [Aphanomyces euteiches]KAH9092832.1 hypothetical protein Ae201684P_008500 [Aphanomyces euteiches]